jgi:hypothetical protein
MESGGRGEIQQAIDSLESLVVSGAKVPLIDQARIGAAELRERIEGVHQAARSEGAGLDREFADAIDELDRVVAEARAIPLTDDVRLDRRRIEAAVELLRARASASSDSDRWGWDES